MNLSQFHEVAFEFNLVRFRNICFHAENLQEMESIMSFIDASHHGFEDKYLDCLKPLISIYLLSDLTDDAF